MPAFFLLKIINFFVLLNLFCELISGQKLIPVACLLGAKFNTDKMLKQITCGKLFHFKSVSWICSARPYPPSAGREFRLCGSAPVSSIPSLSGIHSLRSLIPSANPLLFSCHPEFISGSDQYTKVYSNESFV